MSNNLTAYLKFLSDNKDRFFTFDEISVGAPLATVNGSTYLDNQVQLNLLNKEGERYQISATGLRVNNKINEINRALGDLIAADVSYQFQEPNIVLAFIPKIHIDEADRAFAKHNILFEASYENPSYSLGDSIIRNIYC